MNKGTVAAGGLSGALKGVGTSASLATGGIKAMALALVSSGVGALVVGLGALVGGFMTIVNTSKGFATQMSKLNSVLGDKGTSEIMKQLSDDAKRLGSSTKFTASQVGELQTEFAKLGFTTDQILNVTEATLALAGATGTDLAEAASVAGSTLRGFGLASDQTARVADVMAASFSASSLDMNKFTESMKLVSPISKTLKISIEQSTAALAVMADTGISGSMAGTQLRRVMSDLAMKTGKDFRTSLVMTSERLKNATSDSEKLAIAKELVGDRAKGTVIALAENIDKLDELTEAFDGAAGAAQEMQDKALNNLEGDLTKLSSAWEGFILGLDDGQGIISKLSRTTIQTFTKALGGLADASDYVGMMMDQMNFNMKLAFVNFQKFKAPLDHLKLSFEKFALESLSVLENVPFIGKPVGAFAKMRLEAIDKEMALTSNKIKAWSQVESNIKKEKDIAYNNWKNRTAIRENKVEEEIRRQANEDFIEGQQKADEEAAAKALADKKAFLAKLSKLEVDSDDKTALEKLATKRTRHLAELDNLKLTETEKRDAALRINDLYDGLEADQKEKNRQKFDEMFGKADPLDEINKKQEAHLLALDQLNLEETEKEELKKRIRDHYQLETDAYNATLRDKKIQDVDAELAEDNRLREAKRAMTMSTLDAAADAAGKETAIGKALMAIKLSMQLQELAMKMGLIKDELRVKAQAALEDAGIEGAKIGTATAQGAAESSKIGFPWNVITIAGYALQAASLVKNFKGQKKKLSGLANKAGASGGGGGVSAGSMPQAPSFNVIGSTSAGDNMVAGAIASVNDAPMRAYVVESDVTSAQSASRASDDLSSIGG
tara:strand:+ start:161 stop:2671 length:2511 start_codon:yes stop_codon:yes gene_type:complete